MKNIYLEYFVVANIYHDSITKFEYLTIKFISKSILWIVNNHKAKGQY
jgi:hypothetical protein